MADSITCPRCGMTSYHPEDVAQRYCGNCHQFHDMMWGIPASPGGMMEDKKDTQDALIVVDVQRDFCEGGSLPVEGGNDVAQKITDYIDVLKKDPYTVVVFTKDDHHPHDSNGDHFADEPDYVDTWPAHCVQGTEGNQLHPALAKYDSGSGLSRTSSSAIFYKGHGEPAYSGFQGKNAYGASLADFLRGNGINHVEVCGIAADYCVKATMEDARKEGFDVTLLTDLTVGIHKTGEEVWEEFSKAPAPS